MRGIESVPGGAEAPSVEVDVQAYADRLGAKLAVNGLSVLRYGLRLAVSAEVVAAKIAKHGERAPVSPELPELHDWLRRATTTRAVLEYEGIQGQVAADRDILAILARFEPSFEEADKYYNG